MGASQARADVASILNKATAETVACEKPGQIRSIALMVIGSTLLLYGG